MNALAITGTVQGQVEDVCSRLTGPIKPPGMIAMGTIGMSNGV